jgi:hypothetical protein
MGFGAVAQPAKTLAATAATITRTWIDFIY